MINCRHSHTEIQPSSVAYNRLLSHGVELKILTGISIFSQMTTLRQFKGRSKDQELADLLRISNLLLPPQYGTSHRSRRTPVFVRTPQEAPGHC